MKDLSREKLTAYALGELSNQERAEIEEILKSNPQLQQEVAEIKSFATILSQELKDEEVPRLDPEKRSELRDQLIHAKPKASWRSLFTGTNLGALGAVMSVFVVVFSYRVIMQQVNHQKLAQKEQAGAQLAEVQKVQADQMLAMNDLSESAAADFAEDVGAPSTPPQAFNRKRMDTREVRQDGASAINQERKAMVAKVARDSSPKAMSAKQGSSVKKAKKRVSMSKKDGKKLKRSGIFSAFGSGSAGKGKAGAGEIALNDSIGSSMVLPGTAETKPKQIDREGIRLVFFNNQRAIRSCYERQLTTNSDLEGKVLFQFKIGEAGRVVDAPTVNIEKSTLKSEELNACLLNRLKSWRFPEPPKGQVVDVIYPLSFANKKPK